MCAVTNVYQTIPDRQVVFTREKPAGTAALGLWSGQPVGTVLDVAWARLASADNLCLLVTIFLVIWLSSQMAAAGVMEDLVGSGLTRFLETHVHK